MRKFLPLLFFLIVLNKPVLSQEASSSLSGKIICIDPGHGGTALTDSYRVGPSGEREEWINLRVGLLLQKILEEKGAKVLMTRTEDKMVSLQDRARLAVENKPISSFPYITMQPQILRLIFQLFIFTVMHQRISQVLLLESCWVLIL